MENKPVYPPYPYGTRVQNAPNGQGTPTSSASFAVYGNQRSGSAPYAPYPFNAAPASPQTRRAPDHAPAFGATMNGDVAPSNTRAQKGNGGGQPPKGFVPPPRRKHKALWVILAVLLVAALGVGAYMGSMYLAVKPYQSVFLPNIYIDGVSVGGLTSDEGIQAVLAAIQARDSAWSLQLTYMGMVRATITAASIGIQTDYDSVRDMLNQAWAVGHVGYLRDQKADLDAQMVTPLKLNSRRSEANTQALNSMLNGFASEMYRAPSDASLVGFNPADSVNPFTYIDEVFGQSLDVDALRLSIYQAYDAAVSGTIEITPEPIAPNVTRKSLESLVALRATGYTPIASNSTENRTNNIRQCFARFTGTVLAPGAKLSFNKVVGDRSKKNGFFEAPEYAYGELVTGIGGGSCQASTTLYLAAVCAGLEIVDRTAHSDPVNYTELGQDATVFYSSNKKIDLVFRNNTEHNIYIAAEVTTDPRNSKRLVCYVRIYGESLGEGVSYRLLSKVIDTLPAPTETEVVKDTKETYVKYTDEFKIVIKARDGQVVDTYLQRIENNNMVSETRITTDTYKARAERRYVGVTMR